MTDLSQNGLWTICDVCSSSASPSSSAELAESSKRLRHHGYTSDVPTGVLGALISWGRLAIVASTNIADTQLIRQASLCRSGPTWHLMFFLTLLACL